MNVVRFILEAPFYTTGALLGLFLGYIYATIQVMQHIPGLKWLAAIIGTQLPQVLSLPRDEKAHVAFRASAFAVMESAALGNALYAMETPAAADATKPFPEHNGQQQRFAVVPIQDYTPLVSQQNNITNDINDNIPDAEDQQVLDSVRDRLASFPLDNMSPTTTIGTALSLATNVLAPGGLAADADDDVMRAVGRIPEHPANESELGMGGSPMDPLEGELDITYASSSNNIVRTPSVGDQGIQSLSSRLPTAAAVRSDSAKSNGVGIHTMGTSPYTKKFALGGTMGDQDIVPLTDRAVQQLNQQHAESSAKFGNPSTGLLINQGSPKPAYGFRLPTQRVSFRGTSADSAAAAAGTPELAPTSPRSERSMVSASSVRTTDSDATNEKKKKGLFAKLRQKASMRKQQVR